MIDDSDTSSVSASSSSFLSSSSRTLGIFKELAALGRPSGSGAAPPTTPTTSQVKSSVAWMRTTKLGKALDFFSSKGGSKAAGGKAAAAAAAQLAAALSSYAGEGIVVSYAHFWLLLDMLGTLASVQRCTALQVKRAVEALLVQPRLSPDVAHSLHALLPRSAWLRSSRKRRRRRLLQRQRQRGQRGGGPRALEGALQRALARQTSWKCARG